jgi:hypothetical protein
MTVSKEFVLLKSKLTKVTHQKALAAAKAVVNQAPPA